MYKQKRTKTTNEVESAKPISPATPNSKIKNATKVILDDIKFDSKLEAYFYKMLKINNIYHERQKIYKIQPGFRYNGKAIICIKIIPDFWLPHYNLLIDTKGFQTADSKIKWKMLKWWLYNSSQPNLPEIVFVKNQKEADKIIIRLLHEKVRNPS